MNISLREYNKLIEDLVEKSQIEEAVAHCRHILKEFPQHIDTRRILAGAYLDARKYAMSQDIFQQVLLALPADFVSNLGMSFIYSIEGDIEYAIWHMERAFEKNPNNIGIQDELKKLYTIRDGKEPDRVNKTSGVLVYLYFNSGEYDRAVQAILDILKSDVTRREMKTLLAKIYFLQGNLERSMETCLECFAHSTNNFEANRLMIKIMQKINSTQNLEVYRTRLQELDPYAIHPDSFLLAEELFVPEEAIQVGKLDWAPENFHWSEEGEANSPSQPANSDTTETAVLAETGLAADQADSPPTDQASATSEKVEEIVGETPQPDVVPDWLKDLMRTEPDVNTATTDDSIPDWVMEIEPDPEPVYEQIIPETTAPKLVEPANNQEDQVERDSGTTIASRNVFNLSDWTNTVDLFDDPEIKSAVAKALNDIPTEEELELLAETKPTLFSLIQPAGISTNQVDSAHPATPEEEWNPYPPLPSTTTDEPIELIAKEVTPDSLADVEAKTASFATTEPVVTDQDDSQDTNTDNLLNQENDIPSNLGLPNYAELDWLGDLGKHLPEEEDEPTSSTAEEEAVSLVEVSGMLEASEAEQQNELTLPVNQEDAAPPIDLPETAENEPIIPPLQVPDMPNVTLPEHIRLLHAAQSAVVSASETPEPIEQISAEDLQDAVASDAEYMQPHGDHTLLNDEVGMTPTQADDSLTTEMQPEEASSDESLVEEVEASMEDTAVLAATQEFEELSNIDAPWQPIGSAEMPGKFLLPSEEFEEVIEEIVPEEEPALTDTPVISPWVPVEQPKPTDSVQPEDEPQPETNSTSFENLEGLELIDDPSVLFTDQQDIPDSEPEQTKDEPDEVPIEAVAENETEIQVEETSEGLVDSTEEEILPDQSDPENLDTSETPETTEQADLSDLSPSLEEEPALPAEPTMDEATVFTAANPEDVEELAGEEDSEQLSEALNLQSEELAKAAGQLTDGNLDAALDEFSTLIKQESHLPEVISHLEQLVNQHPTNKKAWRTLGDAHFNANHLQQALDAYSRADSLMDADEP